MYTTSREQFVESMVAMRLDPRVLIVKPNWVDNVVGNFTDAEMFDLLFQCFPKSRKMVIESYTPWRGLKYQGQGELATNLEHGKEFWDFYRSQDEEFLNQTGIQKVLDRHSVEYVNITNEYWSGGCASPIAIRPVVESTFGKITWEEFYGYIPKKLFEIRNDALLVSLAKVKLETGNVHIRVSFSIKNLFGLIPHPSRRRPFHGNDHALIPQVVADITKVYCALFPHTLWINDGSTSLVQEYCEPDQKIVSGDGRIFLGEDPLETDSATAIAYGVDPNSVPYLEMLKGKF